jgi:hypothetical protein
MTLSYYNWVFVGGSCMYILNSGSMHALFSQVHMCMHAREIEKCQRPRRLSFRVLPMVSLNHNTDNRKSQPNRSFLWMTIQWQTGNKTTTTATHMHPSYSVSCSVSFARPYLCRISAWKYWPVVLTELRTTEMSKFALTGPSCRRGNFAGNCTVLLEPVARLVPPSAAAVNNCAATLVIVVSQMDSSGDQKQHNHVAHKMSSFFAFSIAQQYPHPMALMHICKQKYNWSYFQTTRPK